MDDAIKTKEQLVADLIALRQRVATLEVAEATRRQTEASLRQREQRYRQLMEHSLGLLCIHDLDGVLLEVNSAAARALGYYSRDGVGKSLREFLAPAVQHQFDVYLARIRQHPTDSGLLRVMTRTGEERIWLYRNRRYDDPGRPSYVLGHALDITERVQAEQALKQMHERLEWRVAERTAALQESEVRFRGTFENAAVGIAHVGLDGHWLRVNDRLCTITGYSHEELLTRTFQDITHPDDLEADLRYVRRVLAGEIATYAMEKRYIRKDGGIVWITLTVSLMRQPSGEPDYFIAVIEDITSRKQAEQALRETEAILEQRVAERTAALQQAHDHLRHEITERQRIQEALFQQEKLAALGRLLANVAHELNNPLAVAALELENFQERRGSGSWTEDVETLRQAIERCQSVVQSFLALARQQPPTRNAVSLHAVIGDVLVLLGHALEVDGITVERHLDEQVPPVWADANQLHHVVANLLTNAHHALRETAPSRHLTLTTAATADRRQVRLEVTDSGPGIPEDVQHRIFEPFFTTKPQGVGSGLGLPLCRSIVEGHGGTIQVVSQAGHGTTVRVILPVVAADVPLPEAVSEAGEPAQRRRGTILLIDDEPGVQYALRHLLQRSGHEVTIVNNGQEGLAALKEGSYEVILCDVRMPVLDGPGLYRELVRCYPHLVSRLIFLTGDALNPEAEAFFAQVKCPRLIKPFKAQEVRRVIQQVLQAR